MGTSPLGFQEPRVDLFLNCLKNYYKKTYFSIFSLSMLTKGITSWLQAPESEQINQAVKPSHAAPVGENVDARSGKKTAIADDQNMAAQNECHREGKTCQDCKEFWDLIFPQFS